MKINEYIVIFNPKDVNVITGESLKNSYIIIQSFGLKLALDVFNVFYKNQDYKNILDINEVTISNNMCMNDFISINNSIDRILDVYKTVSFDDKYLINDCYVFTGEYLKNYYLLDLLYKKDLFNLRIIIYIDEIKNIGIILYDSDGIIYKETKETPFELICSLDLLYSEKIISLEIYNSLSNYLYGLNNFIYGSNR